MTKGKKRAGLAALATAIAGVPAAYSAWAPQARAVGEGALAQQGGPVAVSLGDSFISGEAGRWWGNGDLAAAAFCTRGGTDRAAYRVAAICRYDPKRVYDDTAVDPRQPTTTGCHRSDVAEINGTRQVALTPVNLACSGAETKHILSEPYKENKASQTRLLQTLAATHRVKLIVVSIGGNDLNVSDALRHCTDQYMNSKPSCAAAGEGKRLLDQLPQVATNVGKAIDKIRQVMNAAGSPADSYKLILQSYPSPVPTSAKVRDIFPEAGGGKTTKRTLVGGCPLWNADFDLMHDTLTPAIDTMLHKVAASRNVTFLSMLHALDGHALCENDTRQAGPSEDAGKLGSQMEWVRYGTAGMKISQGYQQESLHPNAFAQQFQGRCLAAAYQNPSLTQTCSTAT
ncbi:SGNH/GDSL hydrolase family protein [Actinoallomurus soli]|uniref:GDSL-type esterase/lipase family protein n=1 Tax=Actinoallomurus soli TaxID=2952535 RepID=UPI0020932FAF|nr:GDSL-type esterase/lipase family protein [Actinoallomurus soli]MCO5974823.1 GDSL-type esterase/lipase family protein [Actinoallomurus soli]